MGKIRVWSLEKCLASARNYNSIVEWKTNNSGAYRAALRHGWKDECVKYFSWTLEKCIDEAKKHKNITDWRINGGKSYKAALRHGWKDEIKIKIFQYKTKNKNYWTYEKCKEEALKYTTKSEWRKNSGVSYSKTLKNGWTVDCASHMVGGQRQQKSGYWTYERCKEEALKYSRPSDWNKSSGSSYHSAIKMGWLTELSSHMTIKQSKPSKFWCDKQNCLDDAKKYVSKIDWFNNSQSAYTTSKIKGWFDECVIPFYSHEEAKTVKVFYDLNEEIKQYCSEKEWATKNVKSYKLSKKLDLYDVLMLNSNFTVEPIFLEFDMLKIKLLEIMDFETFSEYVNREKFKKEIKEKTNNLILMCDNLIKNSYGL